MREHCLLARGLLSSLLRHRVFTVWQNCGNITSVLELRIPRPAAERLPAWCVVTCLQSSSCLMTSESFQNFWGNADTNKPVCLSGMAQESSLVLETWLRPVPNELQHALLGPGPKPCSVSGPVFGPTDFPLTVWLAHRAAGGGESSSPCVTAPWAPIARTQHWCVLCGHGQW